MRITQTEFYKKFLGRQGERKAIRYLKKKGYKILEKNYTTKFAEADIIALKGDILAFVEVKTRSGTGFGLPSEAVDAAKQRKYCALAEYYRIKNKEYKDFYVRFDVIEVLSGDINHIESAFYADDSDYKTY